MVEGQVSSSRSVNSNDHSGAESHLLHFLPLTLPELSVLIIELNFIKNIVIIARTVYNSLNPDENARTFDLA